MILSQFEEAVWHRRGSDCDIAEAWHHGGEIVSAVEAVLEFGEVAGYMLVADGAVSASDGALDVAEGGVDPLEPADVPLPLGNDVDKGFAIQTERHRASKVGIVEGRLFAVDNQRAVDVCRCHLTDRLRRLALYNPSGSGSSWYGVSTHPPCRQ